MKYLRIKNWEEHQHYKDRNPPWIKLKTNTFQNYEFSKLSDPAKLLAVCCWTIAPQFEDGLLPHDFDYVKRQCNLSDFVQEKHLKELILNGFLIDDSKALADCLQDAAPSVSDSVSSLSSDSGKGDARGKPKVTLEVLTVEHIKDWLAEKRATGKYLNHDENTVLEGFKDFCRSNGKRYSDYVAALRNAFDWERFAPGRKSGSSQPEKFTPFKNAPQNWIAQ